jgi:hypothetical protein
MDLLQKFINQYNGQKGVGNTPENKGQCVGIVEVWMHDVLLEPQVWGNAADLLNNADRNFYNFVYNSQTAIPPRGAVIVFNKKFNGTVGHTGIVTRADVNTFELFEQNNPTGAGCRLHTYPNYAFVDGWIIPKNLNLTVSTTVPVDSEKFKELVGKSTNWDEFLKLGLSLDDVKKLKDFKCPPAEDPRHTQALLDIQRILNSLG